jgi:hypothetical protein
MTWGSTKERDGLKCQVVDGDHVKVDLAVGEDGVDAVCGLWRALVSKVMNFRVLYNAGNFLSSRETDSLWRRVLFQGGSDGT